MKIFLGELFNVGGAVKGVVHSIEGSIYRLSVVVDGREMRVLDRDGNAFRRRSIQEVREALQGTGVERLVLRQQSAYDEMIGQSVRLEDNTMEVQLARVPQSDASAGREGV